MSDDLLKELLQRGLTSSSSYSFNDLTTHQMDSSQNVTFDRYTVPFEAYAYAMQGQLQDRKINIIKWLVERYDLYDTASISFFAEDDQILFLVSEKGQIQSSAYPSRGRRASSLYADHGRVSAHFKNVCKILTRTVGERPLVVSLNLYQMTGERVTSGHSNLLILERHTTALTMHHYEPQGTGRYAADIFEKFNTPDVLNAFVTAFEENGESVHASQHLGSSCIQGLQGHANDHLGYCYWFSMFVIHHILYSVHQGKPASNLDQLTHYYASHYTSAQLLNLIASYATWTVTTCINSYLREIMEQNQVEYEEEKHLIMEGVHRELIDEYRHTERNQRVSVTRLEFEEMLERLQIEQRDIVTQIEMDADAPPAFDSMLYDEVFDGMEGDVDLSAEEWEKTGALGRAASYLGVGPKYISQSCKSDKDCRSGCCRKIAPNVSRCQPQKNCKSASYDIESVQKNATARRRDPFGKVQHTNSTIHKNRKPR